MCPTCLKAELDTRAANATEKQVERVREVSIPSRQDYFNNRTNAIIERRKAIDADASIEDKGWTEAQELHDWLLASRDALFAAHQEVIRITNEQSAAQVRMNQIANQLRKDQQELLKLRDFNYKPIVVQKPVKTATVTKTPKFDRVALARVSKDSGIPDFVLQAICQAKKVTPEDAVKIFNAAKSA
jgi:hypothetical protein